MLFMSKDLRFDLFTEETFNDELQTSLYSELNNY